MVALEVFARDGAADSLQVSRNLVSNVAAIEIIETGEIFMTG